MECVILSGYGKNFLGLNLFLENLKKNDIQLLHIAILPEFMLFLKKTI